MAEPLVMNVRPDGARKVKVVNNHFQDYSESFRGTMLTVPANGHILMGVLEANRFLGQTKAPATKLPTGEFRPGEMPKALQIVELTAQEREELEGVNPRQQLEARLHAEEKASLTCVKCQFLGKSMAGLKTHMTTQHPEMEPVEDDT